MSEPIPSSLDACHCERCGDLIDFDDMWVFAGAWVCDPCWTVLADARDVAHKADKDFEWQSPGRRCAPCGVLKSHADFVDARSVNGRGRASQAFVCLLCRALKARCRAYGLTVRRFHELAREQGGGCAICHVTPESPLLLLIDHCHASGKVRGLLCHDCNVALGWMRDDAERLRSAARYLEAA